MNGQEFVTLLMSRLGNKTEPELRALIVLEANLTRQTVLEKWKTLPEFLVTTVSTLATTEGSGDVDLSGLSRAVLGFPESKGGVFRYDSTALGDPWVRLTRLPLDTLEDKWQGEANGAPRQWDTLKETLTVRPLADDVYMLRIRYYGADSDIADSSGSTSLWLTNAPDVLLAATGINIASKHLKDYDAAQVFVEDLKLAISRLHVEQVRRDSELMAYAMGDD